MQVALLAEGVDRNKKMLVHVCFSCVALLAEGVDRNDHEKWYTMLERVALLAEGVDRNCRSKLVTSSPARSPSSRRAWIEIAFVLL